MVQTRDVIVKVNIFSVRRSQISDTIWTSERNILANLKILRDSFPNLEASK